MYKWCQKPAKWLMKPASKKSPEYNEFQENPGLDDHPS